MNADQADELLRFIEGKSLPIEELHERVRSGGSSWSPDQLRVFLRCTAGVTFNATNDRVEAAERSEDDELRDAIVEAARSFGRPVPAREIRNRLPGRFVTTDEQVKALAKKSPGLAIVGPGLIAATK